MSRRPTNSIWIIWDSAWTGIIDTTTTRPYTAKSREAISSCISASITATAAQGARLRVPMVGIEAFLDELGAKNYRYMRPGLERTEWKTLETGVIDPFGNMISFCEPVDEPKAG
jgi:Glyoxalase superfamily protein